MGRTFDLSVGRRYSIRVVAIDEGWELWVYEGPRRLLLGGTVGIDAALAAWGSGRDAVAEMAEHIAADFAKGRLLRSEGPVVRQADLTVVTSPLRSSVQ